MLPRSFLREKMTLDDQMNTDTPAKNAPDMHDDNDDGPPPLVGLRQSAPNAPTLMYEILSYQDFIHSPHCAYGRHDR